MELLVNRKLRRNPDFIFRNVADECVLVPIASSASELKSIGAVVV